MVKGSYWRGNGTLEVTFGTQKMTYDKTGFLYCTQVIKSRYSRDDMILKVKGWHSNPEVTYGILTYVSLGEY